jgi:signal transduction histidine kinase
VGHPDVVSQSVAQPGPAPHANGDGQSETTVRATQEWDTDRKESAAASPVLAKQARVGDVAAMEIAARTAMALGTLLAEIRETVARLAQTEEGPIANGRSGLMASVLAKVKRGDRLASELLAYSGRQRLAATAVEMLPLLCSLAHLLRGTLDTSIKLTVEVEDDCPPCHVDPQALEEALVNLAINARDAMPQGGRLHLAARLARPVDGVPTVALTLFDSGLGMETNTARCAEVPFFTTKANDPMAGLGLAAVEGFVRQSGGSMQLQTSMGTGTSVTLYLPCAGLEC